MSETTELINKFNDAITIWLQQQNINLPTDFPAVNPVPALAQQLAEQVKRVTQTSITTSVSSEARETVYERMQVAVFEVLDNLDETRRQFDDEPYLLKEDDIHEIARAIFEQYVAYDPIADVRQFLVAGGKRYPVKPGYILRDTLFLCLSLMLEELYEIASQTGRSTFDRFKALVDKYQSKYKDVDGQYNNAELLDGLIDLEYVQKNAVILWGFAGIYAEAWEMVHSANMSKFRMTEQQADRTIAELGVLQPTHEFRKEQGTYGWTVLRDDDKIMKPIPFRAPDLNTLL